MSKVPKRRDFWQGPLRRPRGLWPVSLPGARGSRKLPEHVGDYGENAVDPSVMAVALQLADVISSMRSEGRFNVDTFLRAVDAGVGGTLAIEAPCARAKRAVPEARYVSEGVRLAVGAHQSSFLD